MCIGRLRGINSPPQSINFFFPNELQTVLEGRSYAPLSQVESLLAGEEILSEAAILYSPRLLCIARRGCRIRH